MDLPGPWEKADLLGYPTKQALAEEEYDDREIRRCESSMKINIKYVDDPDTLERWNFDEPAIEFYDELQHVAVKLSKVSGLQIKKMLKEWRTPSYLFLENIESIVYTEKR